MSREQKRTLLVAFLAIVALLVFATLRPVDKRGIPERAFWNGKFDRQGEFDIVAAGDSRMLYAVTSTPFSDAGLGECLNFGFRGVAIDEQFLDSASRQFKEDGNKILILGITPSAFTASALASNGFLQKQKDYKASSHWTPSWWSSLVQRFEPVTFVELSRMVRGRKNPLQKLYHEDGWIASTHSAPNPQSALRFYKVRFDKNPALQELSDAAVNRVQKFCQSGIQVYGFRPPVVQEMIELENSKSGFSYEAFIESFEEAGGVWIDVDPSQYQTYDGSHLNSDSADKLSRQLVKEIQQHQTGFAN